MWDPMGDAAKRERTNKPKPVSKEAKQLKEALAKLDKWKSLAEKMGAWMGNSIYLCGISDKGIEDGEKLLDELKKMEAEK